MRRNIIKSILTGCVVATLYFKVECYSQSYPDTLGINMLEEIFVDRSVSEATNDFFEALNDLAKTSEKNNEIFRRLFSDVKSIMIQSESNQYHRLTNADEKIEFFRHFWLKRDVTPATVENERLVEHYHRLAYVRDRYRSNFFRSRGYDDRGHIYLKHGKPDNFVIDLSISSSSPMESWVYYDFGGVVNFDFVDKGYGFKLTNRIDEGIKIRPFGAREVDSYFSALSSILEKRIVLSPKYHSTYMDLQKIMVDENLSLVVKLRMVNSTIDDYEIISISKRSKVPPATSTVLKEIADLSYTVQTLHFKNKNQQSDLVVSYILDYDDLIRENEELNMEIIINTAIKDTNSFFHYLQQDTIFLDKSDFNNDRKFADMIQLEVDQAGYDVAIDIRNISGNQLGLYEESMRPDFENEDHLDLSSIIFANNVEKLGEKNKSSLSIVRNGLSIEYFPFSNLKRTNSYFIYFEIYGLQLSSESRTDFDIEYQVKSKSKGGILAVLNRLNPFGGDEQVVTVSEKRSGMVKDEVVYILLDFSQRNTGDQELTVKITDNIAGIVHQKKIEFNLE